MTDETTTEQLTEIEGQAEDTPATEYTPPEGWRVLAVGELLQPGDHWVSWEGTVSRPDIQHGDGATVSGGRYIRRIKPEPQPEAEPVQVRQGRWRTRNGDIRNVTPTPVHDSRAKRWPWRDAKYDQTWREDGGRHIIGESPSDLVEYLGPIEPQPQPQPEAVPQPRPAEYTPPEGWRVLAVGEILQAGDMWVWPTDDGRRYPTHRIGDAVGPNQQYIRRIKPQPQPEPQPEPQPRPAEYTPPEGWRVVRFGEQLLPGDVWVNDDGTEELSNILHWHAASVSGGRYIRQIKPEPEPEPQPQPDAADELAALRDDRDKWHSRAVLAESQVATLGRQVPDLLAQLAEATQERYTQTAQIGHLETINSTHAETIAGLHSEIHGLSIQNAELLAQLEAVKAELVQVSKDRQTLQVELDAREQVPQAVSDRFEEGFEQGTARAVETIAEWLEPVRLVDNPNLANETLQHLPQIMRHLTRLDSPEDVD